MSSERQFFIFFIFSFFLFGYHLLVPLARSSSRFFLLSTSFWLGPGGAGISGCCIYKHSSMGDTDGHFIYTAHKQRGDAAMHPKFGTDRALFLLSVSLLLDGIQNRVPFWKYSPLTHPLRTQHTHNTHSLRFPRPRDFLFFSCLTDDVYGLNDGYTPAPDATTLYESVWAALFRLDAREIVANTSHGKRKNTARIPNGSVNIRDVGDEGGKGRVNIHLAFGATSKSICDILALSGADTGCRQEDQGALFCFGFLRL